MSGKNVIYPYALNSIVVLCLLAFMCSSALNANASTGTADESALIPYGGVIAAISPALRFEGNAKAAEVEALAEVAVRAYERAAAEQAVPNAAQMKIMDQAIQQAENKINISAPLRFNRSLQLQKLLAYVLDRIIWGGSLAAIGFAVAWLSNRGKKSRLLMGTSMVLLGCAYALLLPIIAVGVIVAFVPFGIKKVLIARLQIASLSRTTI